jgi:hypothetical protein
LRDNYPRRSERQPAAAIDQADAWLASPSLVMLSESEEYFSVRSLVLKARITRPQVHDARVALSALRRACRTCGPPIATSRGFRRCACAIRRSTEAQHDRHAQTRSVLGPVCGPRENRRRLLTISSSRQGRHVASARLISARTFHANRRCAETSTALAISSPAFLRS